MLRRRARPAAPPSSSPRPAARWPSAPAATACPSSRCPAASSRAPRSATRWWPRSRPPRWRVSRRRCATEIEAAAGLADALAAEWGPDGGDDGEAKALARRLHGTVPGGRRRRADRPGRLPLEVPGQRERQAARVLERAARGRPQRDLRVGGPRRSSARSRPCSWRTRRCTPAWHCGSSSRPP